MVASFVGAVLAHSLHQLRHNDTRFTRSHIRCGLVRFVTCSHKILCEKNPRTMSGAPDVHLAATDS